VKNKIPEMTVKAHSGTWWAEVEIDGTPIACQGKTEDEAYYNLVVRLIKMGVETPIKERFYPLGD
jgi:hypothetical protein